MPSQFGEKGNLGKDVFSDDVLKSIVDSTSDGFALFDTDLNYLQVNKYELELLGLTEDQVIGKNIVEVRTGLRGSPLVDQLKKVLETGERYTEYLEETSIGREDILLTAFKVGENLGLISLNLIELKRVRSQLHFHSYILENIMDAVICTDINSKIISVNKSAESLYGYKESEILGQNVSELLSNDYLTTKRADVLKTVRETGHWGGEVLQKTRNGDEIHVYARLSVLHDDEGNQIGIAAINRDMTSQVTLATQFSEFMEAATDGFLLVDYDMNILKANRTWIRNAGLMENPVGKSVFDIFPRHLIEERAKAYQRVIDTGIPIEYENIAAVSGNELIYNIRAFKVGPNMGLIARDISSQVHSQRRLEALHKHSILLGAADTLDEVASITQETIKDILGFNIGGLGFIDGDTLVQNHIWGIENAEPFVQPLDGPGITIQAILTGESQNIGNVTTSNDFVDGYSGMRTKSELTVPILVSGKPVGVINIESEEEDAFTESDQRLVETLAQNVGSVYSRIQEAERKLELERELLVREVQVEQELELNKLKTRFMSTATHEIRTPLTSILGYTDIILNSNGNLTPDQKRFFSVIQRNVNRLSKLTDDLLNIQRLEEGRLTLNLEPVKTRALLTDVVTEVTPIISDKNQAILYPSRDFLILADRLRIMQVIVNLIINASKFSPDGSKIEIQMTRDSDSFTLSVIDKGVGIHKRDLSKLFTPFPGILVDGNVSGTGLGLSICKGIVELHGGKIWVESDGLGKGSKFSFSLPMREAN